MLGGIVATAVGLFIALVGFIIFSGELLCKLPTDQKIATTCYVKGKIEEARAEEAGKIKSITCDGYFYDKKNVKQYANIRDEKSGEYRVTYYKIKSKIEESPVFVVWIPKKNFHKYYTLEELSEVVNKRR